MTENHSERPEIDPNACQHCGQPLPYRSILNPYTGHRFELLDVQQLRLQQCHFVHKQCAPRIGAMGDL